MHLTCYLRPKKKPQPSTSDRPQTAGGQQQASSKELEDLQSKAATLQEKSIKLESIVQEKESELQRLRQLLQSKTDAAGKGVAITYAASVKLAFK